MNIPFNEPYSTGKELIYLKEAINSGQVSGNGPFTKRCHAIFEDGWAFKKTLLTSSCTDALEMCAMLLDIKPGDEVIVPAYTFVSTALAFAREGATIVFADSRGDNPCIDEAKIEDLITEKTKVIVPVHYNGVSCDMDAIMEIASRYKLWVVEDSAHAFGAKYKGRLLGTIGHLGCFSFHETKVIHCGEGGMLAINDDRFLKRSEILWEKGTNRCGFQRGEVNKYEWIDLGSSFLMSDLNAAFLFAQLNEFSYIIAKRKQIWDSYYKLLIELEVKGYLQIPVVPTYSTSNYSGFYIITRSKLERSLLISYLYEANIQALSHYLDLDESPFIKNQTNRNAICQTNVCSINYQDKLLRLPFYNNLLQGQVTQITVVIKMFYEKAD